MSHFSERCTNVSKIIWSVNYGDRLVGGVSGRINWVVGGIGVILFTSKKYIINVYLFN